MAEIVKMPKLSDTMTEGVVSKWIKKVGDKVKSGDILAEIDSDKATMEFESFYDGTLLYIGVPEKKGAPVDSILAIIGKEGEDVSKIIEEEKKKSASAKPEEKKPEVKKEELKKEETKKNSSSSSLAVAEKKSQPVQQTASVTHTPSQNGNGKIKASPLAKKLAKEKGIIINKLK